MIGEPYGTDMIIAVASSEPLFDRPRPGNTETADVYLRDLQSAIDALSRRGARLAGAAVTLEAVRGEIGRMFGRPSVVDHSGPPSDCRRPYA